MKQYYRFSFILYQYTKKFACMNLSHIQFNITPISRDLLSPILSFKKLPPVAIFVKNGVGGSWCPIYERAMLSASPRWKFNVEMIVLKYKLYSNQ